MHLSRRACCWSLLLLAGCGAPATGAEPPAAVPGGWTIQLRAPIAAPAQPVRAELAWRTEYVGPQDLEARFYRFSSSTVAFEAMQKWRKVDGEMTFHQGRFLIVVVARNKPAQAVGDFFEGLGKVLPK